MYQNIDIFQQGGAADKDLLAANQLVDEGREIIRNKSFKDVKPF